MKHEGMARAMSELDDDLIASACQYRAKPHKTYLFPRMLAAAACLVLIATAALVMHRTPETDIYIDGTALSARTVSAGEILLWTIDPPDESAVYTLYLDGKAAAVLRCDSANGYWVAERP